jgi:hypothetical protein
MAYVLEGDSLASFPIRMEEDDLGGMGPHHQQTYSQVVDYLRRFETKPRD